MLEDKTMAMQGTRRWVLALVLLCASLSLTAAWGRSVLELDAARQPVRLLDWGDAWIDETGEAAVERVATDPAIPWRPTGQETSYDLGERRALWIRFTVPPAPDGERWYLDVPDPSVDQVTLFAPDSIGKWQSQSAGDALAVADWPVPHRHPLMPVVVSAEEPRKYLLRVRNAHSFSAPLAFVSESWLNRHEQRTSLVLGIYFGLAGLAAMLAALSAASLRDRAYAFYAVTVALMGLTQASMTGIAGLHLWPRWPLWNDASSIVLPILAVGSLPWFFSAVVSLPERSPLMHRMLSALGMLSIVAAAGAMLVEPSHRFWLMVPCIALTASASTAALVWAVRRGDRWGLWLLLASLPVVLASALAIAHAADLVPAGFWTLHGMQVGMAIELPLVLLILMLRSQHRRELARRMQGLDRIDPATGLINEHVFRDRLLRLIAISQRLKLRSAVLLVQIANVETIREQFGPRSAAELPLQVAGRLISAAREIDSVARLAEHRFGVLLEGPLTAEELAAAGPRIVARCLMPYKGKPMEWVAQVRVAQALVPMDGTDPDVLLGELQVLLASVPGDSKRAVFTLQRAVATS
ncbi:MAG TPA: 7TM diverse intracellular signaling domain-containing protein [Ramlibacter sp.]|uniref:7TM diverse intracellular signaling domain-containing protein n=1 Tax=Ramlibacter sp. TaxID=1917967 RepID=UPI002C5FD6DE|nr:7TM diverse intracellular signaling domain-containing protein [Ramlibacter sp.]HVZ45390.1 7TM diverse intracellular signaling domain-containing protein [Ramlibacter sp.]